MDLNQLLALKVGDVVSVSFDDSKFGEVVSKNEESVTISYFDKIGTRIIYFSLTGYPNKPNCYSYSDDFVKNMKLHITAVKMLERKKAIEMRRPKIFFAKDFPNGASHCDQNECGFSIYKGVLVQWDEDHDERILDFIDRLPASLRKILLVTQEHEGSISFLWDGKIPDEFPEGGDFGCPCGDNWFIYSSKAINQKLK